MDSYPDFQHPGSLTIPPSEYKSCSLISKCVQPYHFRHLDTNSIFDADVADCLQPMYLVAFFLIALIAHTVCLCYGTAGQLLKEIAPSCEFTQGHTHGDDGCLAVGLSMMFSQTDVMFQLRISLQQRTVHTCTLVCSLSGVLQQRLSMVPTVVVITWMFSL